MIILNITVSDVRLKEGQGEHEEMKINVRQQMLRKRCAWSTEISPLLRSDGRHQHRQHKALHSTRNFVDKRHTVRTTPVLQDLGLENDAVLGSDTSSSAELLIKSRGRDLYRNVYSSA